MPVVMLDTGMATDEHEDYLFAGLPNVISLRDRLTPQNNLAVQTSVIARSRGFVGTCGGLAWLAPMLGIDTVAVYADDRFLLSHIFLATQAYRQMGAARFDVVDLRAAMALDLFSLERVAEKVRQ
jgi:ADP-heptose:LPS heptosyltransferase